MYIAHHNGIHVKKLLMQHDSGSRHHHHLLLLPLLSTVFPNPVLCIMGRHCGLVVLVGVALLLAPGRCDVSCKGIDGRPGEAGIPGRDGLGGLKGDKGDSGNSGTTY